MWHLYLDESGDLGFDFVNKKPSKFFTITILIISDNKINKELIKAVKKVIRKKLNPQNKNKIHELKGTKTTLEVKEYFFKQVKNIRFGIYSITLNKKRLFEDLTKNKERVYNFITRQVVDRIPFHKFNDDAVEIIVDKSKGKPEIVEFNNYIKQQIEAKIEPKTPVNIRHLKSHENHGLQACDLFSYGIFINYERKNKKWREIFANKILYDEIYLK